MRDACCALNSQRSWSPYLVVMAAAHATSVIYHKTTLCIPYMQINEKDGHQNNEEPPPTPFGTQ